MTNISEAAIGSRASAGTNAHMNRRSLLVAAPAIGLSGLMAGATAAAAAPSPIMALFREWEATKAVAESPATAEEVADQAFDRMTDIELAMVALPAMSAQDVAAKICAWTCFGSSGLDGYGNAAIWAELSALAGGAA